MGLDLAVKIIGWAMTIVPLTIFIVISGYMVWGAAEDDEVIKALVLLAIAIFAIGLTIIVLAYFTTFLTFTPAEEVSMLLISLS